ncbi:unnamed protein product, partial [Ectocarpus sp. 6 AP-2014]
MMSLISHFRFWILTFRVSAYMSCFPLCTHGFPAFAAGFIKDSVRRNRFDRMFCFRAPYANCIADSVTRGNFADPDTSAFIGRHLNHQSCNYVFSRTTVDLRLDTYRSGDSFCSCWGGPHRTRCVLEEAA